MEEKRERCVGEQNNNKGRDPLMWVSVGVCGLVWDKVEVTIASCRLSSPSFLLVDVKRLCKGEEKEDYEDVKD